MGLLAKDKSGSSSKQPDPISEGIHHAICYGVYDLGTHLNEQFGGKVRKVLIQWELPEERMTVEREGQLANIPRAISKQYTLSLHEKSNLRRDLESWRGKSFSEHELQGFDVQKILGAHCQLQILHRTRNNRTFATIVSVVPWKGAKGLPEHSQRFFSLEDGTDIPEQTPEWVKEIIMDSDEWKARQKDRAAAEKETAEHAATDARELF